MRTQYNGNTSSSLKGMKVQPAGERKSPAVWPEVINHESF